MVFQSKEILISIFYKVESFTTTKFNAYLLLIIYKWYFSGIKIHSA